MVGSSQGRISRQSVQPVHFAEEPFDHREARGPVAFHRPVEFFLGARFGLAGRRAESLAHDTHQQGQRLTIFLERLPGDQFLRPAHADRRVVLPVDDFELGIPEVGRVTVIFVEELPHILPFRRHVAGRGEKDVVLIHRARFKGHRSLQAMGRSGF